MTLIPPGAYAYFECGDFLSKCRILELPIVAINLEGDYASWFNTLANVAAERSAKYPHTGYRKRRYT
jgi:hypothetical protein